MNKIELKSSLHDFIDQLDNVESLKKYYNELKKLLKGSTNTTWENLTESQKQEVLLAYEESESEENLVKNEVIVNRLRKNL